MCFKIFVWVSWSNYHLWNQDWSADLPVWCFMTTYLKNWFPITSCEEIAKEYREALWGVPGTGMEQPHTWEWGVDSWELRLTLKSEKWTCELSIDQHIRVFEADFSASKCLSESARFLGNPKPLSTDATPFQGSEHLIYINDSPQQISWPGWRLGYFKERNS